jgi:putative transposase
MLTNDLGGEVALAWCELPERHSGLELDTFVVMPNHVHGILILRASNACVSDVVRTFKSISVRRVNVRRGSAGTPLWQRGFYDHVVRDDRNLNRIREYIENNPALDEENPGRAVPAAPGAG